VKRSFFSVAVLAFVLAFLYVPIILVVVYGFIPNGISMSFTDAHGRFIGFSLKWYAQIFSGHYSVKALMRSFWLSLTIAGLATLISCVIGTTAALALHRWKDRLQSIHHALVYTPLVMPDILIGISLLMLFVAANIECGFWTILVAHVTFCVSYVVMTILARLQDFDDRLVEAAYDLGAGPWYTFFKVELPILMPGIIAGGLLAFTLSIDDVVITSFVNGAGTNTFPTYVSSMTKHSKNLPSVFALSTLMLLFTCALAGLSKFMARAQVPQSKGR
jgi:spermidine/putrescine transport system permease protein